MLAQRGTCIKGLIWAPLEQKTESYFSSISSYWFISRMARVENSGIYLKFNACYGNKNGRQNRPKIEKLPFWAKIKAFSDRFLRIRYQHKRIPKNLLVYCVPC